MIDQIKNLSWDDSQFNDYIDMEKLSVKHLPQNVSISTMCASCKLGTNLDTEQIYNYMSLSKTDIITIKKDDIKIRTLAEKIKNKNKNKKKKKRASHFFNQITVVVRTEHFETDDFDTCKKINVKLFRNGSIQMSGCKDMNSINVVLNKIVKRLGEIVGIVEEGKIKKISFVEDKSCLGVNLFKVDMINSNYQIKFHVNRQKLYDKLLSDNISCSFEPCIRACVIVKYTPSEDNDENKDISIFVFEKGNIIITGAKKPTHIILAYDYVNKLLKKYQNEIKMINLDDVINESGFGHLIIK
jgi:TATA-box binding protein (TBP) (component of TFIID and TFIIIB)